MKTVGWKSIGGMIQYFRERGGLSQLQLARIVGADQSVISRVEQEEYRGHSVKFLDRVAQGLGLELRVQFIRKEPEQ